RRASGGRVGVPFDPGDLDHLHPDGQRAPDRHRSRAVDEVMKVAVTGATGYLGGGIAAAFRAAGHEVVGLTRRPCGDGWIPYSLEQDPASVPWQGIDALVHAAHDFSVLSWSDAMARNIRPSIALFEAAAAGGVGRLG